MSLNPLDLPGPAFLAFYAFALIIAHFVGKALMSRCRSDHSAAVDLNDSLTPTETGVLAGGAERAIDATLVRLLRHDLIAVRPGGGGFEVKNPAGPLQELQSQVYSEIARKNGDIDRLHKLRSTFLARAEVRLAGLGLLMAPGSAEAMCVRLAKGLPFAAVIVIGAMKIGVGLSRHRPIAFLVVFVLASLLILGIKLFKLPHRSAKGDAALKSLERSNAALHATAKRRSLDLDDNSLMVAVALFGAQVLSTGDLSWMREGFVNRSSSSSDSGSGGSCSGGCGGGGCGGCGG
jgi:uncharacterized protein (TIGR04222 family)